MNKKILHIAIPSILSNLTVPLTGLIATGIAGHLGETYYIGAIAIGALFFNMIYWIFAFIRLSASGLTAQAYGKQDRKEITRILVQSLSMSFAISLVLLLLQYPVERFAFSLLAPTSEVQRYALVFIRILIWGAPATLLLYAFNGWFIGMQNAYFATIIIIVMNVTNILLCLLFVYRLDMRIEGIAWAALLSQYIAVFMAAGLWLLKYRSYGKDISLNENFKLSEIKRFFALNRDIFLRMVCLVAVTFFFVYAGTAQGDVVLAVNTLMMQLYYLYSFFLDGFALAGEALAGKYAGANDGYRLKKTIRRLFLWGTGIAVVFTLFFSLEKDLLLTWLTNDAAVIDVCSSYFYWAAITPLASFVAFIWDGIMIGIMATRYMLISIAVASFVFFAVFYIFSGNTNNHVLWGAFILYLFVRGAVQTGSWCVSLKRL
ncbi:MAG: MATE family efflux transporter [Prevotellaceae bacterium]|jgi:MATE family multidrug resistance protein|nr:MATE family efflux transporter [Prevotellaceae bacterium]